MKVNTGGAEQAKIEQLRKEKKGVIKGHNILTKMMTRDMEQLHERIEELEKCMTTPRIEDLETIEKLQAVFDAAKGLCFGEDWNNGTHAMVYKQKLRDAVAAIPQPPESET